ncbi:MAG: DUF1800 family protein [Lapillicoccus sp.]
MNAVTTSLPVAMAAGTTTSPLAPNLPLSTDLPWHVARRLAHAATADLAEEIRSMGVNPWIRQQIAYASVDDSACQAMVRQYFPWLDSTPPQLMGLTGNRPWLGSPHVGRATALRQVFSRRVLFESMVEFFGDLLYVPFTSDKSFAWIIDFDREVIRANAIGKYRLMLRAGLTHPAVLLFLDNETNDKHGVNENLGRELLELFTVGAVNPSDGTPNYTEADVRNSSLMLTGHSRKWPEQTYLYDAKRHYVGPIRVMGFTHPNDSGRKGPAALAAYADYLARHPLTARRVATRLCIRFVSDSPPGGLVERLTATYLAHDTDMAPVLQQLFASAEFRSAVGQKIRRPAEYTATAIRAGKTGVHITADTTAYPRAALADLILRLQESDHYPRGWPAVNGYPDVAEAWTSTQAMLARLRAAYDIAAQTDPELPVQATWDQTLGVSPGDTASAAAERIVTRLTGFVPVAAHRGAIAQVLTGRTSPPGAAVTLTAAQIRANIVEAVALVLSSPYFALR